MMGDQEEEDLQMALRMSMQPPTTSPPEPKRSKPRDGGDAVVASPDESPEAKSRRLQRELMAAAAEKRIMMMNQTVQKTPSQSSSSVSVKVSVSKKTENLGKELSIDEANLLFSMVFGASVSKEILAQWSNQGIRFSPDPETSMGLVQHEGGPCGVLAAIQGLVLKYLLFVPEESSNHASKTQQKSFKHESVTPEKFATIPEDTRKR